MKKRILKWLFGWDFEEYVDMLKLAKKVNDDSREVIEANMELHAINQKLAEKSKEVLSEYKTVLGRLNASKSETKFIKINKHGNDFEIRQNGDYIDLCTAEDVEMWEGEFRIISLGVSMELPSGYYAEIVPRSSTFKKYGVIQANGIGVIDSEYCGDNDIWGFPAYATRHTVIEKGTRICQFRLVEKAPATSFVEVPSLVGKNRGGFGSTGEK